MYIVGGYLGEEPAQDLSNALLSELDASRVAFRVVLACMDRLNSKRPPAAIDTAVDTPPVGVQSRQVEANPAIPHDSGWLPRQTGMAIDLATGRSRSVRFEGAGRGPGCEIRHSRVFAGAREEALAEVCAKSCIVFVLMLLISTTFRAFRMQCISA